ncbi:AAA family ATPase [Marinobacter pelagius]|uniref:DNA repair exonuclease SbcCD ATPase subunit n=1 Tax=Marinobacter pelagius TaxID=379482 RepID=A0A1I4ZR97_9GAMM|nr:AAA family ATPase [Marinobacter pelagius]SFN52509.1 DNA repair exonuclease SbcCD ATPase subunit [Marinobacter pelagius]
MRLERLSIEQVRQFRNPITLDGLQPGINLIHGPNESGKSTLVRAIRAAFFERHRSKSVEDLRPWGDSAAAPSIELGFEHGGHQWSLTKSFLQRKRCDLQVDGQSFSGEEAEEKLAELLGYQFPKKGASKEEHWGIPGLLWVEQGTGQDIEKAVEHAGDHLKSALNNLVGEVASTGGDDVIQAVEKQRAELLTGTGKPRGEYLQLEKERAELEVEIAELQARIGQYQAQVDRLGTLTAEFEKANRERPWEEARRRMEQAQEQFRQVESLQAQQVREQETLDHVRQNLNLLRQNLEQMQSQGKKLEQRETDLRKAREILAQEEARTPAFDKALQDARESYDAAIKIVEQARQLESLTRLKQEVTRLENQHKTLRQNLDKATEFQQKLDEARKQKQENRIDPDLVQQARVTQRQLDEEAIRSQTIATRLTWQLEQGHSLHLSDESIEGEGERRLLEETTLEIPGVGRLGITPGGEDLASVRRTLAHLEQTLSEHLRALGVPNVEDAEQKLARLRDAENRLKHTEDLLASVAPQGLERLRTETRDTLADLEARKGELNALLKSAEVGDTNLPGFTEAERARKEAEQRLSEAETARSKHQTAILTARQNVENANREWQQLREELNNSESQRQLRELGDKITESEKREATVLGNLEALTRKIREARPELLQQDIQRFRQAADTQQKAQENRERELRDIRVRLEAWGAEGLEELLSEKFGEFEHINRRYDELHRRARALDLLLNVLTGKRQALTRRLQAPLQKHLDHYLSVLFPEATLEVDEHLMPGRFTRGDELGQMTELSFGAREQMGLISRLAYADLLKDAGRPTLIILDDTLVHSDAERLDGMKRILFDAAQRHQILLFTCHPENWQDLGVEPRDLQALKIEPVP